MAISASTSLPTFWNVGILKHPEVILAECAIGLKEAISTDGVWTIRRRDRSPTIEVFKSEDFGHGHILSQEFLEWRGTDWEGKEEQVEAARVKLLNSIGTVS